MADETPSIDQILERLEDPAYERQGSVWVPVPPQELLDRHTDLDQRLHQLRGTPQGMDSEAEQIARQLRELEDEIAGHKMEFRFRNIGHRAWADLLAAHPPTEKQLKADKRTQFNPDKFPAAAIAATCVKPEGMTQAAAERIEARLPDQDFNTLFNKAAEVNLGAIPKSQAASITLATSDASARRRTTSNAHEASS